MTRLTKKDNNNSNRKVGSDSFNCNTRTTSVVPNEELTLHLVLEAATVMYENNPSLIFQSRVFKNSGLSNAEKLEILKDMCQVHKFSAKTMKAIDALSVLNGLGGIQ